MSHILSRIADYLYPAICHSCEKPLTHGASLCTSCQKKLTPVEPPYCESCGECYSADIQHSFTCPNCHDLSLSFSFARAAYQESDTLRDLIHEFKYSSQIHLARQLATLASEAFLHDPRFTENHRTPLLVPVPLHWRRRRKRRFNQAEEITRHLAKSLALPWSNALKRIRHTDPQTRYSRKQRLNNLHGAFAPRKRRIKTIKNQSIILIDDVFTTGSTTHECAHVLLTHGAKDVAVLTVMRS